MDFANFSTALHLMTYLSSVSMVTYVCPGDMYNHEADSKEPDWVKTEREQFAEFRDKNKDGKMDKEETKDWILPSDYDHAEAEAKHLVYESDTDKVRPFAIPTLFPVLWGPVLLSECLVGHVGAVLSPS